MRFPRCEWAAVSALLPSLLAATGRQLDSAWESHREDAGGGDAGYSQVWEEQVEGRALQGAYLIPLFWATLCRDSLDTAEMTWGRRRDASVTSQENRKSRQGCREASVERERPPHTESASSQGKCSAAQHCEAGHLFGADGTHCVILVR